MAGSNRDGFWNYVLQMDDGSFNCEFCRHSFGNGTSLSRIIWHLSGEEGHGVAICGQVPKEIQEAAFRAISGGNNRHKTTGQRRKTKEVAPLKSGWTLLLTNLILEIASAVFDQLGYALVGMVLAFVALLLSTAELIYMARKEKMSLLPSFHRPSTRTLAPGKPGGTIVEYFGLVGAVWQCFYSTVAYAYARQKKDNPIKMTLLPFIFLLCVVIFKLRDKAAELSDLRNEYGDFQVTFSNENQKLLIRECSSMERLFSSSRFRSAPLPLPSSNGKFSCLKEFYCFGCKSVKKFPLVLLQNLEVIEVSDCEKMVEIIETKSDDEGLIDEESSRNGRNPKLELPKLKELKLIKLPELKSISSATLICNSLKLIHIRNCEKLKRIPIFLPFLESNQSSPLPSLEIIIHPEERWESALEWDHPNAKDALRRFVKFPQETTAVSEIRLMEKKDQPFINKDRKKAYSE